PKWKELNSKEELKEALNNFTLPVVIKPTGLTGGAGVTTGIRTIKKALHAYDFAIEAIQTRDRPAWQTKIMIQEQVEGEDYRLLVINGVLRISTKRIPAFITGDGKKTIQELIDETNQDPRRDT